MHGGVGPRSRYAVKNALSDPQCPEGQIYTSVTIDTISYRTGHTNMGCVDPSPSVISLRLIAEGFGLFPVIGDAVDGIFCVYDLAAGSAEEAAFSCAATVPFWGGFATTAKWAKRADDLADARRAAPNTAGLAGDGARFVVDSAGSATLRAQGPSGWIDVSHHAARRMTQRGISIDAVDQALTRQPFNCWHNNTWKIGYYDASSNVFVGTVNGVATTVIRPASGQQYIANLLAASP